LNKVVHIVLLIFILALANSKVTGQIDSIRFNNGTLLTGEIVSMEKGVLILSTDFSSSNFRAEWKDVVWLKTQTRFLIKLRTENRYGAISTLNDSISQIIGNNNQIDTCQTKDIVYLKAYSDKFSDRIDAEISIGFDMTKSQNLRTFSTRSKVSYGADKWYTNISFNTLNSSQDDTEDIVRLDGALNLRYIIFNKWYVIATESWLSNTEQMLNLRLNSHLGIGSFILKTNRAYWGTKFGLNRNIEKYSDENED
jgi:hypothetical protein